MQWWQVTGRAYDEDGDPFEISEHVHAANEDEAIKVALRDAEYQICTNENQPITHDWLAPFEEEPLTVRLSVPPRLLHDKHVMALIRERDELIVCVEYFKEAAGTLGIELDALKSDPVADFEPEF